MREFAPVWAAEGHVRAVSASFEEPAWLLEDRLVGLFRGLERPLEENRLFTSYVDLRAVRLRDLQPVESVPDLAGGASVLPEGVSGFLHVSGSGVRSRGLSRRAAEAGVVIDTFAGVLRTRPELLREALGDGGTLPLGDKLGQLARAAFSVGVLIHVPAGVVLQDPIVVRWEAGDAGTALISRTLVDLRADAHARVLEEHVAVGEAGEAQRLWQGTMEVRLADGATLDVAAEQDLGPSTVGLVTRQALVGRDAQLRWALASVGGQLIKSRVDNELIGRGASVRQVEIGFGGGDQLFDLTSYTRHRAEDTTGDLLSKGVFLDRARGYIKGLIEIEREARGTDSFLGEFSMLLSKRARSVTIPSLEIDQPDVRRAAHASSVGPIDETQLFYLTSRGLSRDEARKLVVLGFLEPVVAQVPLPEAQDRLRDLLDRKLSAGLRALRAAA